MKILILTSRFGMGHYCVAEAIKEELLESNTDDIIEVVDIVKVLFPIMYKLVYRFFNLFICRFSCVYNFINSFAVKHEKTCLKRRNLNKINSLIEKYNPDLIVSTWSACSRFISTYKEEYEDDIQLYTHITDITAHDGWIANKTNMYFVAARSTMELLLSKGVPAEKIIINGIPVRKSFKNEMEVQAINDKKKILIMGGGLGLIRGLDNILEELYESSGVHITIITGRNKKLLKKIKKDYPKIDAVGYTDEVYKYMERSDLLITKPGGISTFEAIYTTTPLYIIKPFLSQEVGNAEFIEKMLIGKIAWENNSNISEDIISLISNDRLLGQMKYNMQHLKNEISEFKLNEVYERNVKKDVDNYIDNYNDNIFNNIWSNSYINL
jgi:processive 1,2-diacylglycerol beta-glucosyltransferase